MTVVHEGPLCEPLALAAGAGAAAGAAVVVVVVVPCSRRPQSRG
jgi:hypothetical protein